MLTLARSRRLCSLLHSQRKSYSQKSVSLPDLPPQTRCNPAFWINSLDAENYLYPLYNRGWGIKFYPRPLPESPVNDRYVAHLTTDLTFTKYSCATHFLADLDPICEAEQHHPSTFTLRNNSRSPLLTLYVQTHQAFRPRWNQEDPSADPPLSRRVPGITRRDLRFAILVEQLYDTYLLSGRATQRRGISLKHHFDRPSWQHLLTRFIKSSLNKGVTLNVPGGPPSPLLGLAGALHSLEDGNEGESDANSLVVKDSIGQC